MWRFGNFSAGVLFLLMMLSVPAQSVPDPPP